jgi:hypothetical protein
MWFRANSIQAEQNVAFFCPKMRQKAILSAAKEVTFLKK